MNFTTSFEVYSYMREELKKVISHLKAEYSVIRAGRANPKILDRVMVEYYGTHTPLYQMSNITVPDPRCLLITIWDTSALKDVMKALQEANLGINPVNEGKAIRLVFPTLTEERRKEIVKEVKRIAEETRIGLRNVRRDTIDVLKQMKKDNLLSEDGLSGAEKEVQKIHDEVNAEITTLSLEKEKEIMEV